MTANEIIGLIVGIVLVLGVLAGEASDETDGDLPL